MSVTHQNRTSSRPSYVLVSAAYNEEKLIEKVIESIVAQTVPPRKWIIVSDGSTDRTDEIVKRYATRYDFIELHRITEDHPRNFTAQVNAINAGFRKVLDLDVDFIGNLDSDITVDPTYFELLLKEFVKDPTLGLAGGSIYEEREGVFQTRGTNSPNSVAHGVQLFRSECLRALGGYTPFTWGGSDTHAEVRTRMLGKRVQSLPGFKAYHHRPTGGGFGLSRYQFRGGMMDYYLGTHPVYEMARLIRRLPGKPFAVGSLVRFAGFIYAYVSGQKREVSPEFMRFLRKEQMQRLLGASSGREQSTGTVASRS